MGVYDAKSNSFRATNQVGMRNGVADILGVLPNGKFLAIEVKSKSGKVSLQQQKFIDDINLRGGVAGVARCLNDAKELLCSIA